VLGFPFFKSPEVNADVILQGATGGRVHTHPEILQAHSQLASG